uniref:Leucine-rich repeat and IQ domain-containing protein 4-like n=1 Tax=Phallusia mammillata TaxID=59560 RepID=A0A6F9DKV5_9ASCI|nr:leucine-rich repeat and IQ domain-containing protein 4-like [Phallusia mammillata]
MKFLDLTWKGLNELNDEHQSLPTKNSMAYRDKTDAETTAVAVEEIDASHNLISKFHPKFICSFKHLIKLKVCSNCLSEIPAQLSNLTMLKELYVTNNRLTFLPPELCRLQLEVLNLSGNMFKVFPPVLCQMVQLKTLLMGGNGLREIPKHITNLIQLEVLYLGGNAIRFIPNEIGDMLSLNALSLCDNQLTAIPTSFSKLTNLKSLSLHNNVLHYLPREVLSLVSLAELSLRGNPLVARFAHDLAYDPPTLFEIASRSIALSGTNYTTSCLPPQLIQHLNSASKCPNPKCAGVYFEHKYKQIKFVDFCGKYRLPLMQYLCSPECISSGTSSAASSEYETEDEEERSNDIIRRVLLG